MPSIDGLHVMLAQQLPKHFAILVFNFWLVRAHHLPCIFLDKVSADGGPSKFTIGIGSNWGMQLVGSWDKTLSIHLVRLALPSGS